MRHDLQPAPSSDHKRRALTHLLILCAAQLCLIDKSQGLIGADVGDFRLEKRQRPDRVRFGEGAETTRADIALPSP